MSMHIPSSSPSTEKQSNTVFHAQEHGDIRINNHVEQSPMDVINQETQQHMLNVQPRTTTEVTKPTGIGLQRASLQNPDVPIVLPGSIMVSPLEDCEGLPRFQDIELATIKPTILKLLHETEQQFISFEQQVTPTWESTIETPLRIMAKLEHATGIVWHLKSVKDSSELRSIVSDVLPEIEKLEIMMGQSQAHYNALLSLKNSSTWNTLDKTQQRIITKKLHRFKLSGIALQGPQKARFTEIALRLSELSITFRNNVTDAIANYTMVLTDPTDIEGLPDNIKETAVQEAKKAGYTDATIDAGPWVVTLSSHSVYPFIRYCPSRPLREKLYKASRNVASEGVHNNLPILEEMLSLRNEQAQLLGYTSYAQQSLSKKMAKTVENVNAFINQLIDAAKQPAQKEIKDLIAFAKSQGAEEADDFQLWDVGYWSNKLKESKFAINEEKIRSYFPLEQVLQGLFTMVHKLFGVSIQEDNTVQTWDPHVSFYRLYDQDKNEIGGFYLDPFARPGEKRGGAWQSGFIDRSNIFAPAGKDHRNPVAIIVTNFPPPAEGQPALLRSSNVKTIFHEMGHALQHLLTTIPYDSAAGGNGVEWDAIEIPSKFMENFKFHPGIYDHIARHFTTKETLPKEVIEDLIAADKFMAGYSLLRQMNLSLLDMELHTHYDPTNNTALDIQQACALKTSALPLLTDDKYICSFSHIFAGAYAAGYYGYSYSEFHSADAFEAFQEAGITDEQELARLGQLWRKHMLETGGSNPQDENFVAFRGRKPSIDALLRHYGLL